ncbi:DUF6365 family protein [Candidatus Margulisiibacteriota bacterium]
MRILFIITVIKSRGEAYLVIKAAQDVIKNGGACQVLAMPEVGEYVRQHGLSVTFLSHKKEANKELVENVLLQFKPQGVVYASFRNIYLGIGIGKVFEPEWISEKNIPTATFDPEKYKRELKKISSGPLINREYKLPQLLPGMKVFSTDFIEQAKAPENTLFYRNDMDIDQKKELRKKFKWPENEPVIIFPVSRWIYDNAAYFNSNYYKEYLPNLLAHYFSLLKKPMRIHTIGDKELFFENKWDDVTVSHEASLKITDYEQRIRAADLLLTDNGMSGSIEIATNAETPVLVLKNSIKASIRQGQLDCAAQFNISGFVAETLKRMLAENPKAVFPYAIYPLGWWEVVEHLFKDNPLHKTFCEAELFNEADVIELLKKILWDKGIQKKLKLLQKEYRIKKEALSKFSQVAKLVF